MTFQQTFEKLNIFKINAFRRIFQQYLFIIIGVIVILFFVFHSYVLNIKQEKTNVLNNNYVTLKTEIIKEQNIVDTLTNELFIQQPDLEDLNNFLKLTYADYFEYKTERYMNSESSNYYGTLTFIKKVFYSYPNFSEIVFYDKDEQMLTVFSNKGADFLRRIKIDLPDEALTTKEITSIALNKKAPPGLLSFHKTLNNPSTLDNVAEIYYIFNNQTIYNQLTTNVQDSAGDLFLLENNQSIYSSFSGTENNGRKLKDFQEEKFSSNYQIVAKINANKVWGAIFHLYFYFILIALVIIVISFPVIVRHLRNLEGKIVLISQKMTAIQQGDFTQSNETHENNRTDEFGLIQNGLDEMANQLRQYIDNVYVSEIKQKNYQMKTLRSQINPHFLYNTLESIRMKAVINKDDSVAEMLYNTSRLYKNMIKGKELIPLSEELSFCDSYLRLFELRYEDNLFYDISIEDSLETALIEKLSIQPLIENYVIHGIDIDSDSNFIEITCEQKDEDIMISIKDNGKGIPVEKLSLIQEQLKNNDIESSDSMGLLNVNYRIKELFGESYGVQIATNDWGGVSVFLMIPKNKGGIES
ncbi:two-component system, sensor histidine kinase YesM [Enterococcus sp. AZ194]|uniref:sensor histidine kinase n=1 Tax=Enterococcus sp. AZ194 TaxID=2774629 RepID=UPI003F1FD237